MHKEEDSRIFAAWEGRLVWYSRFDPDGEGGGGGCRREAQLRLALAPLNPHVESSRRAPVITGELSRPRRWRWNLEKRHHPFQRYWADDRVFHWTMGMHYTARQWAGELRRRGVPRLAVVTDPLFFAPLVLRLTKAGVPVAALCQNLESLGYEQLNPRFQRRLLNRELDLLSRCRLLVTISREEQFLLRNLNLPAVHFPYYPVPGEAARLTAIRTRRRRSRKTHFLLLGTAGNKSTRAGMRAVITAWKRIPFRNRRLEKLFVAGYWTRLLGDDLDGDGVEILGEIPDDRLDKLLTSVRAALVYQKHGGGALTRVADMLLAGVPVLANEHALRNWYGLSGTRSFAGIDDLLHGALNLAAGIPPPVPPGQIQPPDARALLEHFQKLMAADSIKGGRR